VIAYGATVTRVLAPDREGRIANVALGFATPEDYAVHRGHYFGAIVGRYANRIAHGRFTLDGAVHELERNEGDDTLHGGPRGFDTHMWEIVDSDETHVALHTTSPHGEMGFPGTLDVDVVYTLADAALRIDYRATTDAPTVVNLTNHTCWNLAGEGSGSVEGHVVELDASRFVAIDEQLNPTGELKPVEGTPLDFRTPSPIGERLREGHPQLVHARGYDHTFVLDGGKPVGVRVMEPRSGRTLEVETTEPGVQLYTGNFLDGTLVGAAGRAYRQGDCVALETQHFPDSPNQPGFPSTVLRPGSVFVSRTVYRLGTT
jgi:aldose 1-epimerase